MGQKEATLAAPRGDDGLLSRLAGHGEDGRVSTAERSTVEIPELQFVDNFHECEELVQMGAPLLA